MPLTESLEEETVKEEDFLSKEHPSQEASDNPLDSQQDLSVLSTFF